MTSTIKVRSGPHKGTAVRDSVRYNRIYRPLTVRSLNFGKYVSFAAIGGRRSDGR
jgi:hypothetical protein